MLTGRWVQIDASEDGAGLVKRLVARVGEPVVRAAVSRAIRIMGEQFVLGRGIEAALARGGAGKAALFLRHAGRGRPHRRRCGTL